MVILLFLTLQVASAADYRDVGGYVYEGESRFVDNVWNFISQFKDSWSFWEMLWGRNYDWEQYYYCEDFQFNNVLHHLRVDYMDFSYYSGHGNHWLIGMRPGESVWLPSCPGYGDLPNGGDLEFLVFQSCAVIPGPPDVADWWSNWWESGGLHIFQGMHQAMGYRTSSWSGNSISTIFGQRVKVGQPVWQSWFNAVNDQRAMSGGGFYPGYASAVMHPPADGDTIYNYCADPSMTSHWLRIYWQE
jgi:hypothetical protein